MLQGMQRLDKKNDSRTPITIDILQNIIPILHMVCSSNYETHLLSAAFLFGFFGFLKMVKLLEMFLIIMLSKFLISNLKEII